MYRKPIDIVIPVYNAYEDLVLCMRSIRRYTNLSWDRVILINDCSTDERIVPYLETQEEENVLFINNGEYKGFSENVNAGILLTEDRDVLLLDSDTEVTKDWLDKMAACAYSSEEIGTAAPLSNNASVCSVPAMCQDNFLPENISVDEYAEIIERCSMKCYPRTILPSGFCIYMKRETIKRTGLFDSGVFDGVYGAAQDFCCRAGLLGYTHAACDDTFVFHKGTPSCRPGQGEQLIDSSNGILRERYPLIMKKNLSYFELNPDQYILNNINLFQRISNSKKNVLYLVHSDFRIDSEDNVGGTQFHVRDMVMDMKNEYNVFVLARTMDKLRLSVYIGDMPAETLEFYIGGRPERPVFRNADHYRIYDNVLRAFNIDLVHVHHTSCLTFDIFYAAHALNIPIHLTLHDFYLICPNEKLMCYKGYYCGVCRDSDFCVSCLKDTKNMADTVDYITEWRQECGKVLRMCEQIYTPSESTKDIFLSLYSGISEKIQPIYHGCEFSRIEDDQVNEIVKTHQVKSYFDFALNHPEDKEAVMGWAFLEGTDSRENEVFLEIEDSAHHKHYVNTVAMRRTDVADAFQNSGYEYCGFHAKIFRNLYRKGRLTLRVLIKSKGKIYADKNKIKFTNKKKELRKNHNFNVAFIGGLVPAKGSRLAYEMIMKEEETVNWYIFGNMNDDKLQNLKQKNLLKLGAYERNDLPQLLSAYEIDIICILSIWPETFSYTVSEALMCKVPVLASDIGAMGERIRKNGCGWLVDKDADAEIILGKLKEIMGNRADYEEKKRRAVSYQGKSIEEMAEEYRQYYRRDFTDRKQRDYDKVFIGKAII